MVPINTDLSLVESLLRRLEAVITAKGERHHIKPCGLRMVRIIWIWQLEVLTRLILIPVSLGFPSLKPYLLLTVQLPDACQRAAIATHCVIAC